MSARSTQAWEIAVESFDFAYEPRIRPNPAWWFWYAYWGRLPQKYSIWVLHDVTCGSWVVRHIMRALAAAVLPVSAIVIFLPGALSLRALTAFIAGACAVLFATIWVNESVEHRLLQAGYRWGLGASIRSKRDEVAHQLRTW
ncbi:MAG: DUF5313 family protein [Jatrophihabitans sp.]